MNASFTLPPDAVRKLQAAAGTDPRAPPGQSFERTKALEAATAAVKSKYPQYFKKEQYHEDQTE